MTMNQADVRPSVDGARLRGVRGWRSARLASGALPLAIVVAAIGAPVAATAAKAPVTPKVKITKVSPTAGSVGVRGTVTLPAGVKASQASVIVGVSGAGQGISKVVKVSSKRGFRVVLSTGLSGDVLVQARLKISGKAVGPTTNRQTTIPAAGAGR